MGAVGDESFFLDGNGGACHESAGGSDIGKPGEGEGWAEA